MYLSVLYAALARKNGSCRSSEVIYKSINHSYGIPDTILSFNVVICHNYVIKSRSKNLEFQVGLGIKEKKICETTKSGETRKVAYICRYTSGNLIPNSVLVID